MVEFEVESDAPTASLPTVVDAAALRQAVAELRRGGQRIGFVPTMGALHAGHLSLVELARQHADRVVVSIFVNPTQFGPDEDLDRYPRTPEADAALLAGAGCDLLFLPAPEVLYPNPEVADRAAVEPGSAARGLEGARRPGHFRGVATVVCQLFHLVTPEVAVFGRKDAQQLAVIEQLVRDLHLPVEIVAGETVREADGLALSSRNRYLAPSERQAATVLSRALVAARRAIRDGETSAARVRRLLERTIAAEPRVRLDYAEVVDADSFSPVDEIHDRVVLPLAAFLGETRLIDNFALDPQALRAEASGALSPTEKEIPCSA